MKKIIIIAAALVSFNLAAHAQANSSASQTVNLNLADAIDISYQGSGSGSSSPIVNLAFNTVTDYANGVVSWDEHFKVRSNKNFKITVKTNSANFTYSGTTSPAPVMPANTLQLIVTSHTTGGTVAAPFTLNNTFAPLSSSAQELISNGVRGGDQMMGIKYKGVPGFNYPAGSYTIDVIFTATQL